MATPAVLRSRDCLRRNPQFNHVPKPHNRSRRNENKNRIPVSITGPKLGEIKILKRGDPLPEEKKIDSKPHPLKKKATAAAVEKLGNMNDSDSELLLGSATRLGPEPEMVQKQIKVSDFNLAPQHPSSHFYAGSGPSVASPHPSSLPLPIKLTKKNHSFFS